MEKGRKAYNRAIGTLVVLFVLLLCVLSAYNSRLRTDITDNARHTMENMLQQQSILLSERMESDLATLQNCTRALSHLWAKEGNLTEALRDFEANTPFDDLLLMDAEGMALNAEGERFDLRGQPIFLGLMQGESGVFELPTPLGDILLPIAVPIYVRGELKGALIGGYCEQELMDMIPPLYQGKSELYVTNQRGDVLLTSVPAEDTQAWSNRIDLLQQARFLSHDTVQTIAQNIRMSRDGYAVFDLDGKKQLISYRPLSQRGWTIFMQTPEDVITGQAQDLTKRAVLLTTCILLLFFHLVAYILWEQGGSNRERERHAEQLERLAYYDALTALPNLRQFKRLAEQRLQRYRTQTFLLVKVDVVNFKVVNEIFGFATADRVLCLLAEEGSRGGTDPKVLAGRINSDEFILLYRMTTGTWEEANAFMTFSERFLERVHPLLGTHRLELRYGRYLFKHAEESIEELLERVNLAHYAARGHKGIQFCDYDESMRQGVLKDIDLGNRMNLALERGEYQVHLQPKISLHNERIVGAEALVRWRDPESEHLMSPVDFLPLFERNGFITKLDLYMYEQICQLIRSWMDTGQVLIPISVNFSRLHLSNPVLTEDLAEIAERYGVPKQYIIIELTESVIYENEDALENLLNKLHALGFGVSMDDFGTGYSSLGLLKNLCVDEIKIDRSFFSGEQGQERAKTVLCSVMSMAKRLGIATVVEGVESREQADFLRQAGCDMVQGYYYATPVSAELFYQCFEVQAGPIKLETAVQLSRLGDLQKGRPILGRDMPLALYRLLRDRMRRGLSELYGEGEMMETMRESGLAAGRALAVETLDLDMEPDAFLKQLLHEMGRTRLGIWQLEWKDTSGKSFILSTDSQGIGKTNEDANVHVCQYEEGVLAGIFYEYTGKEYLVREISCRCHGAPYCRFELREK